MNSASDGEKTSRRSFLGYVVAGIGAFIASVLGASTAIFAASPLLAERRAARVALGPVDGFQVGVPKLVGFTLEVKDGWVLEEARKSVWVVRERNDAFLTYSPRCTHLGCIVSWIPDQRVFRSPCHDGVFAIDGQVLSGPPPRPLDRLDSWVEDGKLVINYVEFRLGIHDKLEV
jgi:menaquinol-cytochrome c reductase iron-sulfur subunit